MCTNHSTCTSEICQLVCQKLCNSNISENSSISKSKDAKEVLQNLSDILNTNNKSAEQLNEGHNLIFNLFHILHNGDSSNQSKEKCDKTNDSDGSIKPNSTSQIERNTNEKFTLDIQPLDLSINNKSKCKEVLDNDKVTVTSNVTKGTFKTILSNDLPQNITKVLKLKPKKIDDTSTITRKGPMKAIGPIVNCFKKNGKMNYLLLQ